MQDGRQEAFGHRRHALVAAEAEQAIAAPGLRLAGLSRGFGQGVGADQAQARQPFRRHPRRFHGHPSAQGMAGQGEPPRRLVEQGLGHVGQGPRLSVAGHPHVPSAAEGFDLRPPHGLVAQHPGGEHQHG